MTRRESALVRGVVRETWYWDTLCKRASRRIGNRRKRLLPDTARTKPRLTPLLQHRQHLGAAGNGGDGAETGDRGGRDR